MLSDNLATLAARLRDYEHTGMALAPEAITAICAVIDTCAEDARALERHTIPPAGRALAFDGNVVPMTPRRHRDPPTAA